MSSLVFSHFISNYGLQMNTSHYSQLRKILKQIYLFHLYFNNFLTQAIESDTETERVLSAIFCCDMYLIILSAVSFPD